MTRRILGRSNMLRSVLLAGVFVAGFASLAPAATIHFHATINAAQGVPPKQSSGTGEALATLNTASRDFTYTVTWEGLTGPAIAAHFHGPAGPGANAKVQVPIEGKNPTSPAHGSATLSPAQMKDLEAGKWYVNVHTKANPGGEIRGQVLRVAAGAGAMKPHAMPMHSSAPMKTGTAPVKQMKQ